MCVCVGSESYRSDGLGSHELAGIVSVRSCIQETVLAHTHTNKQNTLIHTHVLMRDEKEGRKKQARSNKQQGKATQHTQGVRAYTNPCDVKILPSLTYHLFQQEWVSQIQLDKHRIHTVDCNTQRFDVHVQYTHNTCTVIIKFV